MWTYNDVYIFQIKSSIFSEVLVLVIGQIQASTRHRANIVLMLTRSLRHRSNIDPTLAVCLMLAEMAGESF